MIDAEYCQTMAAYNGWMNRNVYEAAATLTDAERKADRGAFFRSLHSTLNHILWADRVWLSAFQRQDLPRRRNRRRPPRGLRRALRCAARDG